MTESVTEVGLQLVQCSAADTEAVRQHAQHLVVHRIESCTEIYQYQLRDTAVVDCTNQIAVDDKYCYLCRVEWSVGRLLGWKQSVQVDMVREALGDKTLVGDN